MRKNLSDNLSLFAVSPPGLEIITAQELKIIGIKEPVATQGGVNFSGNLSILNSCNLKVGTASRILMRVGKFLAPAFPQLARRTSQVPWELFLTDKDLLDIHVTSHHSKLYHTGKIAEVIMEGIHKRLCSITEQKNGDIPDQKIFVRIIDNYCTISIDTSGDHLHCRGYRLETAKAPLRENLACGILSLCGWDGQIPLIDPMCGAGTFPIEGAILAAKMPPNRHHKFAFHNWPIFKANKNLIHPLENKIPDNLNIMIKGSDNNYNALNSAKNNAERSGIGHLIQFEQISFEELTLDINSGLLIINPPYGQRIKKEQKLIAFYSRIGNILTQRFKGFKCALLCPDHNLQKATGLSWKSLAMLDNGGIKINLLYTEL